MSDNKNAEAQAPVRRIEIEEDGVPEHPTIPAAVEYDYKNFYFVIFGCRIVKAFKESR